MSDNSKQALSVLEKSAADQAFELFAELEVDQLERVLEHVHERLTAARAPGPYGEQVMFSRGPASPFGKLTCVAKTKVDEPTYERFLQRCATHGTDVATVLRDWIYYMVYEKTCQQMIAERITDRVAGLTQGPTMKGSS